MTLSKINHRTSYISQENNWFFSLLIHLRGCTGFETIFEVSLRFYLMTNFEQTKWYYFRKYGVCLASIHRCIIYNSIGLG